MTFDCCKLVNVESRLCAINAGIDKFNRGGLIELYVICDDAILEIPAYRFGFDANNSALLSGTLKIKSDAEAYLFRFTPETGGFTEDMQENDNGIYFDQLLSIMIPKDRPDITWLKYQMRHKRYSFLYRDKNGLTKFLPNQRVKFNLNTNKKPAEYNGHTMFARKAALKPALHWNIAPEDPITDVFLVTTITFGHHPETFPSGFAAGQTIELPFTPYSEEATLVKVNSGLKLRVGTHYVVSGNILTLLFGEIVEPNGHPSVIDVFSAFEDQATELGSFVNHIETFSASYSSGQTITLPSAPIDQDHVYISFNDVLGLRPDTHFTLSGDTVTILFAGNPSPGDEDTFNIKYITNGGGLAISGFKQYVYETKLAIPSGTHIFLPQTPISGSLLVFYDESTVLREGVHYNITGNDFETLFDIPATSGSNPSVLDFWYPY